MWIILYRIISTGKLYPVVRFANEIREFETKGLALEFIEDARIGKYLNNGLNEVQVIECDPVK